MSLDRLVFTELSVIGATVPPATLRMVPGLNLLIGASNTGKTFFFNALNFMLGASDLEQVPEAMRYEEVAVKIESSVKGEFSLKRAIAGGSFHLQLPDQFSILAERHSNAPSESLSAFLLQLIGLEGRQVRTNERGEKRSLSFRDLARLTLISEERMIQKESPLCSGQPVRRTAEKNIFALLLTGQDDAAVIQQENARKRKARLLAEEHVVQSILDERVRDLQSFTNDPGSIQASIERLDESIRGASQLIAKGQEQLDQVEKRRAVLVERSRDLRSRITFLDEQAKRLKLLDHHYESDVRRLHAVIEAATVFHELPVGNCPLCSRLLDAEHNFSHEVLEQACQEELSKIKLLQKDLHLALADFDEEGTDLSRELQKIESELSKEEQNLKDALNSTSCITQAHLQELISARTAMANAATILETIRSLEIRLGAIRQSLKEKGTKSSFKDRVTASAAAELCSVIEALLREWKYPDPGHVSYDTERADLVIGGQDRANNGKGYRAITYAAFTIGLMRYCRMKRLPHPGFVVLDTPINPFRGPSIEHDTDRLSDTVKKAFFESLAADKSGDQIIVIENEEPPASVLESANFIRFSKNVALGRYGFFPGTNSSDR